MEWRGDEEGREREWSKSGRMEDRESKDKDKSEGEV